MYKTHRLKHEIKTLGNNKKRVQTVKTPTDSKKTRFNGIIVCFGNMDTKRMVLKPSNMARDNLQFIVYFFVETC
jgi:uncharacterized protein with GYD domain